MTAYNFGDVILVPFPFTDQSQAKQRPAVVVSSVRYNTERPSPGLAVLMGARCHGAFAANGCRLAILPRRAI